MDHIWKLIFPPYFILDVIRSKCPAWIIRPLKECGETGTDAEKRIINMQILYEIN